MKTYNISMTNLMVEFLTKRNEEKQPLSDASIKNTLYTQSYLCKHSVYYKKKIVQLLTYHFLGA